MNYWYVLPPAAVATGITSLVARAGTFRADARADRLNQQAEVGEQARKPDAPECGMPQRRRRRRQMPRVSALRSWPFRGCRSWPDVIPCDGK